MDNNKYVVFKISDWLNGREIINGVSNDTKNESVAQPLDSALHALDASRIDDAVVIRQQDIFAGPALHAYAASIGVALTVLRGVRPSLRGDDEAMEKVDGEIKALQELADFFSEMAVEADAKGFKRPD